MNIHLSKLTVENARDVAGLTAEEIANLVERMPQSVVLGLFPRPALRLASDPHWVHALRGDCIADADDSQQVVVLTFPTSAASFEVKQILRLRAREREKHKKLAKLNKLEKFTKRAAAAAE
jgi:hypothetical protein